MIAQLYWDEHKADFIAEVESVSSADEMLEVCRHFASGLKAHVLSCYRQNTVLQQLIALLFAENEVGSELLLVREEPSVVIRFPQRKKKNMDSKTMEYFIDMSGGMDPTQFVVDLQNRKSEDAKKRLLAYYDLFKMLQESKINGDRSVVISDKEDELISHTRGYGNHDARPEDYLDAFSNYVQTNINEIAALKIVCTRPRELTRDSLKSLLLTLDREGYTVQQLNTAISQITNEEMTADIISIIRRYAVGSVLLSHEARIRKAVDRLCKAHNFTMQERNWIKRMETYLLKESVLNMQVFDEDSRFKNEGGFAKINKVFGNKLESVVIELNEYLYDDGGRSA